uniref:Uncharacterized protein n=1 Tax=Apteryx owenii TaxID=8824 RepID=A0A8B9S7B0_APTOW
SSKLQLALDEGDAHYLYTDSWVVYKGLRTWLPTWAAAQWKIHEKELWGTVSVRHVDTHQKQETRETQHNTAVDQMATPSELKQAWQEHERSGHRGPIKVQAWDLSPGHPMLVLHWYKTARANCPVCMKITKVPFTSTYGRIKRGEQPFATWQVDYVGPLPPSQGLKYILTLYTKKKISVTSMNLYNLGIVSRKMTPWTYSFL